MALRVVGLPTSDGVRRENLVQQLFVIRRRQRQIHRLDYLPGAVFLPGYHFARQGVVRSRENVQDATHVQKRSTQPRAAAIPANCSSEISSKGEAARPSCPSSAAPFWT